MSSSTLASNTPNLHIFPPPPTGSPVKKLQHKAISPQTARLKGVAFHVTSPSKAPTTPQSAIPQSATSLKSPLSKISGSPAVSVAAQEVIHIKTSSSSPSEKTSSTPDGAQTAVPWASTASPTTAPSTRSGSPTLVRSNSAATSHTYVSSSGGEPVASNRSIFPRYDTTKPLSQQGYYSPFAPPPQNRRMSELAKDAEEQSLYSNPCAPVPLEGYECVPMADNQDVAKLWKASCRKGSVGGGRKVQLPLHQPAAGTSLVVSHQERQLYVMECRDLSSKDAKHITVHKTCPNDKRKQLVANIPLNAVDSDRSRESKPTPIFPHQAAIDALNEASNSPQAAEIAVFDPSATSAAAERLARDAVNDAHHRCTAELVRATRCRDSLGAITAQYKLKHDGLGELPITVSRSTSSRSSYGTHDPRAKLSIHHPTATPGAIAAGSLELISLDFARNACVIDLPAISNLDGEYVLDLAISALFATAVLENDSLQQETMTFAPPPTAAIGEGTKASQGKLKKVGRKGKGRGKGVFALKKTGVERVDEGLADMPTVAKGALAIVGLGIHSAFWLLEKGAKALEEKASRKS